MSRFEFSLFSEAVTSQLVRRKLRSGEVLFEENSPAESMYFCEQGCVRLEVFPEPNKPVVLFRARANEPFAEEHLVIDRFSYRAIADEQSVVIAAPKQLILNDIRSRPDIAFNFVNCLARRYYQTRVNYERLAIKSAKDRVRHLLTTMAMQSDQPLELSGKIKSFSNDLNLTHEATYRALRELEQDGTIKRENGVIELLNFPPA